MSSSYRTRDVQRMLSLSRGTIAAFVRHGFVTPRRGPRNAHLFSFDDLIVLRVARDLARAQVSPARIAKSLRRLRAGLPKGVPPAGLRISAAGDRVVVRAGDSPWQSDHGQYLLDFSVTLEGGVASFRAASQPQPQPQSGSRAQSRPQSHPPAADDAARRFELGCAAEADDPALAQRHYRSALALDPAHAGACANLGRLLHESGRLAAADAVYRAGLQAGADDALVHFNFAVLLEDRGRPQDAIRHYEAALRRDRDLADGHYNLALLHESLGQRQKALRHLLAYRRLEHRTPRR